MRFTTIVKQGGKTATGLPVPEDVVRGLKSGLRPRVRVTIGRHCYRSTVARMGGQFLIPLSADNRSAAGVAAGDTVQVEVVLDTEDRTVEVPVDFAAALAADESALRVFERLSYSQQRWHVLAIEGAKRRETRARRIAKSVATLAS